MVNPRLSVTLLALAAACGRGEQANAQDPAGRAAPIAATAPAVASQLNTSRRTAIVDATARVSPSVVSIRVVSRRTVQPSLLDGFFGVPQEQTQQSFGTGFIMRADGIIVTNQHVVAGASQITVTLADGTDLEGRLLGEDPLTDIAVIKVERDDLPVPPFGRSDDLQIGEWAIAMGNPYSFLLGNSEPTVTAGVISAAGRNIVPSGAMTGRYYDMIQTDAAINPGNSGGPLVNALGQVIGVSASILSNTGESVGVGFAIPIERALRVARELVQDGSVRRAWVGLDVAGADRMNDWKSAGGVPVVAVVPDGPAARAGLQTGDVLVRANGRRLRNYLDWEAVLLDIHIGDRIDVVALSDGREASHRIVPADLPTVTAERVRLRGLDLTTLTPAIRAQLGVRSDAGATIVSVPDETTRLTGLRDGDVIVRVDYVSDRRVVQAPITSTRDLARVLDAIPRDARFRLWYERQGRYVYVDLRS
ncbi:MAG: trypsin-like peptidase domain-containing protein [Gemmatimonadetes bacterium]|nr:trypsin-like peptidase domain-containing protein [Gemmatimonadota bacterium]